MGQQDQAGTYELGEEDEDENDDIWQSYQTNVEICIALRDVDYHYSIDDSTPIKSPIKNLARKVVVNLKPPGSIQWVEKCVTETVFREKNPKFATKLYFPCEKRDASGIVLRFDIHDSSLKSFQPRNTISSHIAAFLQSRTSPPKKTTPLLGSVEVNLESIIKAKSNGLELPILSLFEPYKNKSNQENRRRSGGLARKNVTIDPGRLFLRAELLKPMNYAVLLKFGLRINTDRCYYFHRPVFPFYFEIYKLNPETLFQIQYPYTLLYRSELIKYTGMNEEDCWNYIVIPVSRVCNGDLGRVLKLEIYQTDRPSISQGFALTTLRKLLIERELVIPVSQHDGKVSQRLCLYAPLCHEVPLHPMQYYLNKGLTIKRLFAVDYSSSNWNVQLHLRPLHDPGAKRTVYEEAIIMTAGAMIEIAQGDSIFYSFGNTSAPPYVTSFGPENHIHSLLRLYRDALYNVNSAMESSKIANNIVSHNYVGGGTSSNPVTPSKRSRSNNAPTTLLAPLLSDLATLLSVSSERFEYQVVFIFTDGQICDIEESKQVILSLAKLPVSLIFIGIGMADFQPLLKLEQDWIHSQTREFPCRKIIHVIHFRNLVEWDTSIHFANYSSSPPDLFRKEIVTTIRDQMPSYMRIFRTAI